MITICFMQCNTSPSHRVDQVVDCGLWNVGPLLFNSCAKLLDIGRNYKLECKKGALQTKCIIIIYSLCMCVCSVYWMQFQIIIYR